MVVGSSVVVEVCMVVGASVEEDDEDEEVEVRSAVDEGLDVVEGSVVGSFEVELVVGTEVVVTVGDWSVVVLDPEDPAEVVGSFCEVEVSVGGAWVVVVGAAVGWVGSTAEELLPFRLARFMRADSEELCSGATSFSEWETPWRYLSNSCRACWIEVSSMRSMYSWNLALTSESGSARSAAGTAMADEATSETQRRRRSWFIVDECGGWRIEKQI